VGTPPSAVGALISHCCWCDAQQAGTPWQIFHVQQALFGIRAQGSSELATAKVLLSLEVSITFFFLSVCYSNL